MEKDTQAYELDRKPALTKPISIRLTKEEIVELKCLAGDLSVSEYVRRRIFSEYSHERSSEESETRLSSQSRQKLLAQVLMRLGKLDTIKNINSLMDALRTGLIDISPEAQLALNELHTEIKELRQDLLKALGLRS